MISSIIYILLIYILLLYYTEFPFFARKDLYFALRHCKIHKYVKDMYIYT